MAVRPCHNTCMLEHTCAYPNIIQPELGKPCQAGHGVSTCDTSLPAATAQVVLVTPNDARVCIDRSIERVPAALHRHLIASFPLRNHQEPAHRYAHDDFPNGHVVRAHAWREHASIGLVGNAAVEHSQCRAQHQIKTHTFAASMPQTHADNIPARSLGDRRQHQAEADCPCSVHGNSDSDMTLADSEPADKGMLPTASLPGFAVGSHGMHTHTSSVVSPLASDCDAASNLVCADTDAGAARGMQGRQV
jgi:hypothetical protein